ncbi:MAG: 30S ribosomal protein S16 [Pseudomonadota bacterium]|nr:30S ribosomal protein S16 [Pseudomonadota bacterium]
MPTTIRLSRAGTHKRPYYRIVVTSSRSPRDSKFIERIGTYNPLLGQEDPKRVTIDAERAKYWLSVGAQISSRVHGFFNKAGIVDTKPAQRAARKPRKDKGGEGAAPAAEGTAAPAAA